MNKTEILIIDDEPQLRKLLCINLESNDYKVIEAETGKQYIQTEPWVGYRFIAEGIEEDAPQS